MEHEITCSKAVQRLETMFRALNTEYFGGALEEPIITIQSTPKCFGHITVGKVWSTENSGRRELNIGAESLNRSIEKVAATLVHEMVHLYCAENDIKDTSRGGTYHNKRFQAEAEKRGLHIEKADKIGYSVTTPKPELCKFVKEQGWEKISMARSTKEKAATRSKNSTHKYQCPCCGQGIRATKEVKIICGECMELMEAI